MIVRAFAMFALVYLLGFLWFAAALPQPVDGGRTDAVVVPTGGPGRINRGLAILEDGAAREMLVTGVDREVKTREFVALYKVPPATMECCVTLGFAAVDTRSNADETATWVEERGYKSLRLVTTDWHMRRAAVELARSLPDDITILRDAVPSRPRLGILFLEYNKLLAAAVAQIVTD